LDSNSQAIEKILADEEFATKLSLGGICKFTGNKVNKDDDD